MYDQMKKNMTKMIERQEKEKERKVKDDTLKKINVRDEDAR